MENVMKEYGMSGGSSGMYNMKMGGNNMDMDMDMEKPSYGGKKKKNSMKKCKHKHHSNRKGGNVLSELAVPAVLLLANQQYGKRSKKNFSNRRRFSRRRRSSRFF